MPRSLVLVSTTETLLSLRSVSERRGTGASDSHSWPEPISFVGGRVLAKSYEGGEDITKTKHKMYAQY
jgi:hypothetical protein